MKKILLRIICALVAASVLAGAGVLVFYQVRLREYKNMDIVLPDGFTYTGHTGCNDTPYNSLESIETAVKYGADVVEFDLYFNGDEYVLAHDKPVGGEVTLREALIKVREFDGIRVNLDLKVVERVELVEDLVAELGMLDRVFFTGVNESFVKAVSEGCPNIPYYLNVNVILPEEHYDNYLKSIINRVKQRGAIGINFNKKNATKELVDAFHKEGLLVSIWTVDKEIEIYEILSYCPDNITTNRPDILREILNGTGE